MQATKGNLIQFVVRLIRTTFQGNEAKQLPRLDKVKELHPSNRNAISERQLEDVQRDPPTNCEGNADELAHCWFGHHFENTLTYDPTVIPPDQRAIVAGLFLVAERLGVLIDQSREIAKRIGAKDTFED